MTKNNLILLNNKGVKILKDEEDWFSISVPTNYGDIKKCIDDNENGYSDSIEELLIELENINGKQWMWIEGKIINNTIELSFQTV
jgi:hypothetical protein